MNYLINKIDFYLNNDNSISNHAIKSEVFLSEKIEQGNSALFAAYENNKYIFLAKN